MDLCPCGSGKAFEDCCGPYVEGKEAAPTAEALMRSRYTAHCLGRYEYLNESILPEMRDEADEAETREWSELVEWQGLEILSAKDGGPDDETGEVSFEARYALRGSPRSLREDAFFRKKDGRWYYADGVVHGQETVRRQSPKVGRNDPCPCGSGKKYKKCCGAA